MNSNHPWQSMLNIVTQSGMAPYSDLAFKRLIRYRLLTENVFAFLLQYAGLTLTTVTSQPFPIWFAPGVALGFLFMRGYTILPGIWLGGLLAYYLASAPLSVAMACTSIFTLQTALLLWISYRYISPTLIFNSRSLFMRFMFCSAAITAISSLLLVMVCFHHIEALKQYGLTWWLANVDSLFVFGLAIATWDYYFAEVNHLVHIHKPRLLITYGCAIALIMAFLFAKSFIASITLACLILSVTLAISRLFKWCGSVSALFLLGLFMTLSAFLMPPLHLHIEQILIILCAILIDLK
jgi:integral membrane sensor domain MASE1